VFRLLPWRAEILRGLIGADLIGFHTPAYARNFSAAVVRLLGHEPMFDELRVDGRRVRFGAYPMGIDAAAFAVPAPPPELHLRPGERLLLGIDRLDYTKGIRRRLMAVDRVLKRRPDLRGKLRVLQIAVPSREKVDEYEAFRARVEQTVGAINGRWSTLDGAPIHYLYRGFSQAELIGLYRAADVMLVTPLRDGMNLVAKEFAAARGDGDGVLVLSEFAGAADEMPEALHINPYDVDGMADAICPRPRHAGGRTPGPHDRPAQPRARPRRAQVGRRLPRRPGRADPQDRGRRPAADPRDPARRGCSAPPAPCCCSTTTAPSSRSPRAPSSPRPTASSCSCSPTCPKGQTPACT
jgi:hypothetical protein